jgi:hypothetical protein
MAPGRRRRCRRLLQQARNAESFGLLQHGRHVLVPGAESALRIAERDRVDAGAAIIFVVNEAPLDFKGEYALSNFVVGSSSEVRIFSIRRLPLGRHWVA